SCTYAPKLASDRPHGRCPSSPPPTTPVIPCTAIAEPARLDGALGAASGARARPPAKLPDRRSDAAVLAVLAVASGTQDRTPAGLPSPSPPVPTARGTPNTSESCRTA